MMRARKALVAGALAVLIGGGGAAACGSSQDGGKSNSTTSGSESTATEGPTTEREPDVPTEEHAAATDESTDSTEDSNVLSLTDTATTDDGFEISLSNFSRGVTGAYDIPENTPFVQFTITAKNGTSSAVDLSSELSISCSHGSSAGEQVYSGATNEGSGFTTSVLPGRTASAVFGCTLPPDEKYLQVEVSPSFEIETAIFSGNVAK